MTLEKRLNNSSLLLKFGFNKPAGLCVCVYLPVFVCVCPPDSRAGLQADPEHCWLQLQRDEQPAWGEVYPQRGKMGSRLLLSGTLDWFSFASLRMAKDLDHRGFQDQWMSSLKYVAFFLLLAVINFRGEHPVWLWCRLSSSAGSMLEHHLCDPGPCDSLYISYKL